MPDTILAPAEPVVRNSWHGYLTGETANTVAAHLRARFEGPRQRFTVVTSRESEEFRARVRTSQRLRSPIKVEVVRNEAPQKGDSGFLLAIRWHDSSGLMLCIQSAVREGRWPSAGAMERAPYVSFGQDDDRHSLAHFEGRSDFGKWSVLIASEDTDNLVFPE